MAKLYARQTALNDVKGRLDYISNPDRQENLLAVCDTAADLLNGEYWNVLATESQEAFKKYGQKTRMKWNVETGLMELQTLQAVEGREIVLKLSNALRRRMTDQEIVQSAAKDLSQILDRPVRVALHYNELKNNLHLHIIYSERELLKNSKVKIASRALFYDEKGKRCYRKTEILDEQGRVRVGCKIVPKGEAYETKCFARADPKYSDGRWLEKVKAEQLVPLLNGRLRGDQEVWKYDPATGELPQQHIGNKLLRTNPQKAEEIRRYNENVMRFNDMVRDGWIDLEDALVIQEAMRHEKEKNDILERFIRSMEEHRSKSLKYKIEQHRRDAANWKKYRELRDRTWRTFVEAQRVETRAIYQAKRANYLLYLQNSFEIDPTTQERQMFRRSILEENGYFEQRAVNDEIIRKHTEQLRNVRAYQSVAKQHQIIMRKLMLAGAEQRVIDNAMNDFAEAMHALEYYAANPAENDYEGRRLKVAQFSLEQAQKRAERYIAKQQAQTEISALMTIADYEHQEFENGRLVTLDMDKMLKKEQDLAH